MDVILKWSEYEERLKEVLFNFPRPEYMDWVLGVCDCLRSPSPDLRLYFYGFDVSFVRTEDGLKPFPVQTYPEDIKHMDEGNYAD